MTLDLEALAVARADEQIDAGAWRNEDTEIAPLPVMAAPIPNGLARQKHRPGRCSVPGCRHKARARGLCELHYRQAMRRERRAS